jgi:hypothetical protein
VLLLPSPLQQLLLLHLALLLLHQRTTPAPLAAAAALVLLPHDVWNAAQVLQLQLLLASHAPLLLLLLLPLLQAGPVP